MNKTMSNKRMVRNLFLVIGFVLLLSFTLMILTTPVHEAIHVGLSNLDPCLDVSEFHPFAFQEISSSSTSHTLPSILGCVIVKPAYPGAFMDRPVWADALQEIICLSVQLIITIVITLKTTVILIAKLH